MDAHRPIDVLGTGIDRLLSDDVVACKCGKARILDIFNLLSRELHMGLILIYDNVPVLVVANTVGELEPGVLADRILTEAINVLLALDFLGIADVVDDFAQSRSLRDEKGERRGN